MKQLVLKLIHGYQKRPARGTCRFTPTCSEYCFQAIKKYGMIKGVLLGLKRILKCHPWNQGGSDPLI